MIAPRLPGFLRPADLTFRPSVVSAVGPQVFANAPQAVVSDAGHWRASYSEVFLRGAELLQWRAFLANLEGFAGVYQVPVIDCGLTPRDRSRVARMDRPPFDDGAGFSFGNDDPGAEKSFWREGALDFRTIGYAPLRSTSIRVRSITDGVTLAAGNYITFVTGRERRLHVIKAAEHVAGQPGWLDCRIWPPLRASVDHGAFIDAETPSCPMALANAEPGMAERLRRYGYASLEWREIPW